MTQSSDTRSIYGPQVKGATDRTVRWQRSSAAVSAYQKEWIINLQDRASHGEPIVYMIGDSPIAEIFEAMDIPTVVGAWWSAMIVTKRLSGFYGEMADKNSAGFFGPEYDEFGPCARCVGGAQILAQDPEHAPYGGLPKLSAIISREGGCLGTAKANELELHQLRRHGFDVPVFNFQQLGTPPYNPKYPRWWERINEHWDEVIEPYKVDYVVEELKALIKFLEATTGKTLNQNRLMTALELSNEQNMYWKKARDLIAETVPCPVDFNDQFASYPAQWHRGTPEARDLIKMFYEEVKEKVDNGEVVCPDEKLRLAWVRGRPLAGDNAFYQYFEKPYKAVFVCGMILSIGADSYYRRAINGDPLRAIASRLVFLGIYSGPDWTIKDEKQHKVSGAMMYESTCPMTTWTGHLQTKLTHEAAGIPMLILKPSWDAERLRAEASRFIEERLLT